jgi:hypothetical protein
MPRALALLLAVATLVTAPAALGQAQNREPDLSDLWSEYPLDQSQGGLQRLEWRERDGSTAGPPPRDPERGGPIALAFLYAMLGLAALTAVLAIRRLSHLPLWRLRLASRVGRRRHQGGRSP